MLQYKKIQHCSLPCYKKQDKWFVFRFTDGLYGIKYDEESFKKYVPILTKVQDRVGITEKEELRIFIDVNDLVFLEQGEDKRVNQCLLD